MSRFAVGRKSGWFGFRKRTYDRIFDEGKMASGSAGDLLHLERKIQTHVLALAGVPLVAIGDPTKNLEKEIALDLPPMSH